MLRMGSSGADSRGGGRWAATPASSQTLLTPPLGCPRSQIALLQLPGADGPAAAPASLDRLPLPLAVAYKVKRALVSK